MSHMMRVRVRYSGYQGGPGYNVLHFAKFGQATYTEAEATECGTRLRTLFDTIKLYLPNVLKIDVMPEVDIIQADNGSLSDAITLTPGATVTGTAGAGAQFAAAAGAVITWKTQTVRNGRRMRGRSFIVPLANTGFATDGTLDTGLIAALTTQANLVRTNATEADLVVYGRPTAPAATDGLSAFVQSVSIPDMGAILRSRRD